MRINVFSKTPCTDTPSTLEHSAPRTSIVVLAFIILNDDPEQAAKPAIEINVRTVMLDLQPPQAHCFQYYFCGERPETDSN
ncbi:MAG: hypothetical protein P8Y28_05455 [Gammaproteobacteria bacterium]